ncbi:MAG: recombinase family protein [Leptolyngbyaceae bacterium]|nr:recombinase family protein [Leptolyngbyaceae bacterium]
MAIWCTGAAKSGKTTRLIEQLEHWHEQQFGTGRSAISPSQINRSLTSSLASSRGGYQGMNRGFLVFAANGENRIELADRIEATTRGRSPFDSTTPFGFFQSELTLFWPLVANQLQLTVPFPLRLRPETEQVLATRLWREQLDNGTLAMDGVKEYYMVRRTLDLFQLASNAGIGLDDIPILLEEGLGAQRTELWESMGSALRTWRRWCLERGLLTYGLIADLYHSVLLPQVPYQQQLCRRYQGVLADDVDEYPAIAHAIFTIFLDNALPALFTFNPDGAMRLGFGADPQHLNTLSERCHVEFLAPETDSSIGASWAETVWMAVENPLGGITVPPTMQSIQTTSRADLLRRTADVIHAAIENGQVQPQEIAVLGPGLDAIARYTLRKILNFRGVSVTVVNDQQPLASSPMIRALMTLMALVYPGLGRLIDRDAIAEMLIALGQQPSLVPSVSNPTEFGIDPVRAGIITDYCFRPDPLHPMLLPVTTYERWDRLGHQATERYRTILQWIQTQQQQQQQRTLPSPVVLLDRAIQSFWFGGSHLPYDQLSALRELMETAQHYWDVDARLQQVQGTETPIAESVASFIQLLRDGTITADPYPVQPMGKEREAVTLATLFQYRATRKTHRWHFWLDAGSALWLSGGAPLFGSHLFLRQRRSQPWTAAEEFQANQDRLRRNVINLLGHATERVYLCHSDLATTGQEQDGPLMSLVNAAPVDTADDSVDLVRVTS